MAKWWVTLLDWLAVILGLAAVAILLYHIVYSFYMEHYTDVTGNNASKLKVGDKLQYRFKAVPTAIMVSAFGPDGKSNNIVNDTSDQLGSISCTFCDLPGAIGTYSMWIGNGGNYLGTFPCGSTSKYFASPEFNVCKTDSDCNSISIQCTPPNPCNVMIGGASSITTACIKDSNMPAGGHCDLTGLEAATKNMSLSFFCADDGYCRLYQECPPPPVCFMGDPSESGMVKSPMIPNSNQRAGFCYEMLQGLTVSGGNYLTNILPMCTVTNGLMNPECPCTGCYPGQSCGNLDPTKGYLGTCEGTANGQNLFTRVDFIAEGTLIDITPNEYRIRWDQVQCIYPFVNMSLARGPQYFLGCVMTRTMSNAKMQAEIFGAPDGTTGGYLDAFGPPELTFGSSAVINFAMSGTLSQNQMIGNMPWYLPSNVSSIPPNMRRIPEYSAKQGRPYKMPDPLTYQTNFFDGITSGIDPFCALSGFTTSTC